MTTVIELYGAPGSGKSTYAAYLFHKLKTQHKNVELVREYVKDWMYLDRQIDTFDQFYILGKQLQKESIAYGKVDILISDCPLWLIAFYEEYRLGIEGGPCVSALIAMQKLFDKHTKRLGFFMFKKDYPHSMAGREHSEDESVKIEEKLLEFLIKYGVPFQAYGEENVG